VAQFGVYVKGYYMFEGDVPRGAFWTAVAGTVYQLAALSSLPLFRWLADRIGKRNTLLSAIGCAIMGEILKWFIHQPGVPPIWLPITAILLAPYGAMSMLVLTMLADVCDWDEATNGVRREGTFVAVMSLCTKVSYILSPLLSGLLLAWSGFDAALGKAQSTHTLLSMRVFYSAVPFSCACIAFGLMLFCPPPASRVSKADNAA
jgi:Na+/melibiose symporter-like transporter